MAAKRRAGRSKGHCFDRKACLTCGRHLVLEAKTAEYEADMSKQTIERTIAKIREFQKRMVEQGLLDARDRLSRLPEQELMIKDLLPLQGDLYHPNKFCYVANRPVLEMPILVIKLGGIPISKLDPKLAKLARQGKYVILDGHTRSAVKLSMAKIKSKAKIKAVVLVGPIAAKYFETHYKYRTETGVKSVEDLIERAKYEVEPRTLKKKKHPEACPGVKEKRK
ncbi:MAG: hypothetical protein JW744_00745 [Candidatus Diapherotrites archaeon]|uniref:Uncharacterized protein n=1 Tax=Candidatus Iainarchaeum sp. TaxID=3101447 RepID=A0A939C620_9ARCH|nr:hypothetical protein [Candidatus Diapherotrites archaeon]